MENNNEIIDYEELFKKDEKPPLKDQESKSILALVLYFFILIAGGLLFLGKIIADNFYQQYDNSNAGIITMNYVASNDNTIGLVSSDKYEELLLELKASKESLLPSENDDQDLLTRVGEILIDGSNYVIVISNNVASDKLWLTDVNDNIDETVYLSIIDASNKLWPSNNESITFITTKGSNIYNYYTDNNYINEDSNFSVIEALSTNYVNVINFVLYIFITVPVLFIYRKNLKYDFDLLKASEGASGKIFSGFLYMLLTSLALGFITMILQQIFSIPTDSVNQATVVRALQSETKVLMILSAVVLAPVVEELIFRKAIFTVIKNPKYAILTSSLAFGLIHVSNEPNILFLLVQIIPYIGMGFFLSYYYEKHANRNIMILIAMHALNNFVSVIPSLFS